MSLQTKENLKRLGLGGVLTSNSDTQFIDDIKITHKQLQNATLDIINEGTLRNPKPVLVIKELTDSSPTCKDYRLHRVPVEENGHYVEIDFQYKLLGQLSFFNMKKKQYDAEENDNFIRILENSVLSEAYYQKNAPHGQFVYPTGNSNTSRLTGIYTNATGKAQAFVNSKNPTLTGRLYSNSFNYRAWKPADTAGKLAGNYSDFYLPYPLTIYQTNYNGFNTPVKVTTFGPEVLTSENETHLNGILVISTGDGTGSRVCYVSPHGAKSGLLDTFVFAQDVAVNSFNGQTGIKKISSGLSVRALSLGSEYFVSNGITGHVFSGSGIGFSNASGLFDDYEKDFYVTGITGYVNPFKLDANQHLWQSEPLKDTLFYKFYNSLYDGAKKLSTGTWDGIIPANTVFQIELISTELNKKIGLEVPIHVVYTGYGSNDNIDAKTTKYLQHLTSGIELEDTTFLVDGNSFQIKGRGYGATKEAAWTASNKDIQYNINNKVSKILKKNIVEVIKQNSKFKKFIKFYNRYRKV